MAKRLDMPYIRKQEKDEGLNKDEKAQDEEIEVEAVWDEMAGVPEGTDDEILALKEDSTMIEVDEQTKSKRVESYDVSSLKMAIDILEKKFAELGVMEGRETYDDFLFEDGEIDERTYLVRLEAEKQRMEARMKELMKAKAEKETRVKAEQQVKEEQKARAKAEQEAMKREPQEAKSKTEQAARIKAE